MGHLDPNHCQLSVHHTPLPQSGKNLETATIDISIPRLPMLASIQKYASHMVRLCPKEYCQMSGRETRFGTECVQPRLEPF